VTLVIYPREEARPPPDNGGLAAHRSFIRPYS
jgi:hypothetical protein